MQNDNRNDYNQYYDTFPYKSYEEIVAEKNRKRRLRKSIILLGVLFLLSAGIVMAVGIFISGQPLRWLSDTGAEPVEKPESQSAQEQMPETPPESNVDEGDFEMTINGTEGGEAAIVVKDVSDIVKKSREAVVGVVTESYSNFSSASSGSGIILSEDGYVVTNNHVISGGDSITVVLDNGNHYPAYLIGSDEYTDLAVLKIEAKGLVAAEFGDSDLVEAGQAAVAIGNPTGQLQGTVTAGIISAVNRNVVVNNTIMNLIQTDASINSGNSGGPLLNQYGQVIGVNSIKVSLTGYEGLGFAIPSNTVKPIVEQLINNGYVSGRPLVGIHGQEISQMAARFYGYPQGIYINAIEPSSNLVSYGIQPGDIIIAIDGERVITLSQACQLRNSHVAGDTIKLTVYRSGKTAEVDVVLMEQSTDKADYNF